MKQHLLTLWLTTIIVVGYAQQTYIWNVPTGSWTDAASWLPTRTTPATNDILVFNSNATVTNMPASESIGKLSVENNAIVTVSSSLAAEIQIGHVSVAAPQFSSVAGTTLSISGSNAIQFNIATGNTGEVAGTISAGGGAHILSAATANALVFKTGSVFIANTGFSGNPFGSTNLNSVVFESGSRFISRDGSNPFAASAPSSVVIFQPGSTYDHQKTTAMSISGRTYGNVELNVGANHIYAVTLGQNWIIQNNLIINDHNYTFNPSSGSGSLNIAGDIIINGAANLVLGSTAGNAVQLIGTHQQLGSGSGSGTISINHLINNNSSTTLHRPVSVTSSLNLQNGFIKSSSTALLTLSATATIQSCIHSYSHLPYTNMGCNSSYIDGPVEKQGLGNNSFAFPTGINGVLRPIIIHNATGDFTAAYMRGNPQTDIGSAIAPGIHHISGLEYWSLSGTGTANAELSFIDPNSGGVTDMNALKVAWFNGGQWADAGTTSFLGSAGANGSVTTLPLTSFGYFSLAGSSDYPNNPLPDKTYGWNAIVKQHQVQLSWLVLNDRWYKEYIVERSINGQSFQTISGGIPAKQIDNYQYIYHDALTSTGNIAYRLKMITHYGITEYTEIRNINTTGHIRPVIFPNPASEKINIKIPLSSSISELTIVNISGSVVKRVNTNRQANLSIDISTLSSGVYYIKFNWPAQASVLKFIKF